MVSGSRKKLAPFPNLYTQILLIFVVDVFVFTSPICIIKLTFWLLMQSRWAEIIRNLGRMCQQPQQPTTHHEFMAGDYFGLFLWLFGALGHWWLSAPCAATPRRHGGSEAIAAGMRSKYPCPSYDGLQPTISAALMFSSIFLAQFSPFHCVSPTGWRKAAADV